jgi:hypothetical protein
MTSGLWARQANLTALLRILIMSRDSVVKIDLILNNVGRKLNIRFPRYINV